MTISKPVTIHCCHLMSAFLPFPPFFPHVLFRPRTPSRTPARLATASSSVPLGHDRFSDLVCFSDLHGFAGSLRMARADDGSRNCIPQCPLVSRDLDSFPRNLSDFSNREHEPFPKMTPIETPLGFCFGLFSFPCGSVTLKDLVRSFPAGGCWGGGGLAELMGKASIDSYIAQLCGRSRKGLSWGGHIPWGQEWHRLSFGSGGVSSSGWAKGKAPWRQRGASAPPQNQSPRLSP